jgi:conjugative transfer region lipoprotein (TIGR03751 family)
MLRRSTKALALMLATSLTGCVTNSEKLLTHGGRSMDQVWRQETGGDPSQHHLLDALQALRRPLDEPEGEETSSYTRTAKNEIYRQFHRLPNPDLVMYVFPLLAGTDPVPVPGYSTVFPLYQRVQYALPGERTEDY